MNKNIELVPSEDPFFKVVRDYLSLICFIVHLKKIIA